MDLVKRVEDSSGFALNIPRPEFCFETMGRGEILRNETIILGKGTERGRMLEGKKTKVYPVSALSFDVWQFNSCKIGESRRLPVNYFLVFGLARGENMISQHYAERNRVIGAYRSTLLADSLDEYSGPAGDDSLRACWYGVLDNGNLKEDSHDMPKDKRCKCLDYIARIMGSEKVEEVMHSVPPHMDDIFRHVTDPVLPIMTYYREVLGGDVIDAIKSGDLKKTKAFDNYVSALGEFFNRSLLTAEEADRMMEAIHKA